jgi:hypothetical protein
MILGMGLSSYSSFVVVVENVFQPGFKMLTKTFYLLATGANRVDIASLKFKV